MTRAITTRAELIDALRVAAELEHGLMAQYLFAVYSLKRYTYEGLDPVALERVRRWSSSITLIARQEMEHLGLALNLLSAIGGTPSFSRPNMPQRADYYGPDIKMTLTRGDLDTIQRFQRFEAPDRLTRKLKPGAPVPQNDARKWCKDKDDTIPTRGHLDAMLNAEAQAPRVQAKLGAPPVLDFRWSSVQELYQTIRRGFDHLSATLGEKNLFVGKPSLQIFGGPASPLYGTMNDLNQYGLDLIGVSDLASARQAITMILEQGEGIAANAAYLRWTHFCLFTGIRNDMEEFGLGDIGARPVVANPMTILHPDVCPRDEVTLLTNPTTIEVARLFNGSYELMLLLLLYLYSDNVKTQKQVNDLMDAAFFPLMTMFVRPLAEILTELPAFKGPVKKQEGLRNAGPGFELNGDVLLFPSLDATWDLFQERFDALVLGFDVLLRDGDPWIDLPGQREAGEAKSQIWRRLQYIRGNMERLAADWRARWLNIGTTTQ